MLNINLKHDIWFLKGFNKETVNTQPVQSRVIYDGLMLFDFSYNLGPIYLQNTLLKPRFKNTLSI